MSNLLSVSAVCAMPAGTKESPVWVEGFVGICRAITKKNYQGNKTMFPCIFGDEETGETLEVTFFTVPKFQQGDKVEFSGKGMRRSEFNGKAQVAIGKDTVVTAIPGSRVQQVAHAAVAEKQNGEMINGAQVGGAMKTVFEALLQGRGGEDVGKLLTAPSFWAQVYEGASDYIRVSRLLEGGKLADPVKTRGGGTTSVRQAAPPPRQQPQHDPERELVDEDVPF